MGPFTLSILYGCIWNKPGVPSASDAITPGLPPRNIRSVLVGYADGLSVEWSSALRCQVKDELVAIIDKPVAINWLIVANAEVSIERCPSAAGGAVDCDRLNPMNDVLQFEMPSGGLGNVKRSPWTSGRSSDI